MGDGPAGCVAALLLARWGARVGLLGDPAGEARRPAVGEVLPPAGRAALERLGLGSVVADPGHRAVPGSLAAWGSDEPAARDHLGSPFGDALALDRARFRVSLREAAVAAGATPVPCARGRWSEVAAGPIDGVGAPLVVDASGRPAAVVRAAGARVVADDRLVAVVGVLARADREVQGAVDADRRVLIASTADGWWSSTLLADGRRIASFHTDRDLLPGRGAVDRAEWWARLREAPVVGDAVRAGRDAAPSARVHLVAADSRRLVLAGADGRDGRPTVVAAGDAEMAFDPLSSLGILAAISSAEESVVVAMALLESGSSRAARERAADAARTREVARQTRWERYRVRLSGAYAEETRWANRPFWARRQPSGSTPGQSIPLAG